MFVRVRCYCCCVFPAVSVVGVFVRRVPVPAPPGVCGLGLSPLLPSLVYVAVVECGSRCVCCFSGVGGVWVVGLWLKR